MGQLGTNFGLGRFGLNCQNMVFTSFKLENIGGWGVFGTLFASVRVFFERFMPLVLVEYE